jgi:hypothetical protein
MNKDGQAKCPEPVASTPIPRKTLLKPVAEQTIQDVHHVICTMRTAHQNQSKLIALADQKANALIGVLAVVFSILFTSAQHIFALPLVSQIAFLGFLLTEIIGIAYALLVIFPKNISIKRCKTPEDMSNPLFFGAYTQFDEQEYIPYLAGQLITGESACELLLSDFYQVGMVLKCKYGLLRRAYLLAVSGFILLLLGLASGFLLTMISGL